MQTKDCEIDLSCNNRNSYVKFDGDSGMKKQMSLKVKNETSETGQ